MNFTIGFLVLLLLHNLTLLVPRKSRPKVFAFALPLGLVLGCFHLWLDGFSWILAPAYGLILLQGVIQVVFPFIRPSPLHAGVISARLLYILPGVVVSLGLIFLHGVFTPVFPPVSGPWAVGAGIFQEAGEQVLAYYPLKSPSTPASAAITGPIQVFPWESNFQRLDTGISLNGEPARGRWSLVVVNPGSGLNGEDLPLLLRDLASWGFVCIAPRNPIHPGGSGSSSTIGGYSREQLEKVLIPPGFRAWDSEKLRSAGLKILSYLTLDFNGRTAVISSLEESSRWSSKIYWNYLPKGAVSTQDLILGDPQGRAGAWSTYWPEIGQGDWTENSRFRPWLKFPGVLSSGAEDFRRERTEVIRQFLLWKLRDGGSGVFESGLPLNQSFRIIPPEGDPSR